MKAYTYILPVAAILLPTESLSHSGGTDEYGCHTESATGNYHCHGDSSGSNTSSSSNSVYDENDQCLNGYMNYGYFSSLLAFPLLATPAFIQLSSTSNSPLDRDIPSISTDLRATAFGVGTALSFPVANNLHWYTSVNLAGLDSSSWNVGGRYFMADNWLLTAGGGFSFYDPCMFGITSDHLGSTELGAELGISYRVNRNGYVGILFDSGTEKIWLNYTMEF